MSRPAGSPYAPEPSAVYDVAIVGGGIVGVCLARALATHKGVRALLLEKGIELATGATKANSGIVHAEGHASVDLLKGQFLVDGNRIFDELAKELCFGYRRVGEYLIALNETEAESLRGLHKSCVERGIDCSFVEHEHLLEMEPNINPGAVCGIYYPNAKVVNPYEATMQIGLCAARNGVKIGLGREVLSIAPADIKAGLGSRVYKIKARLTEPAWFYPEHASLFQEKNAAKDTNRIVVEYTSRVVINCAGEYVDRLSQSLVSALYAADPEHYPAVLDYFIAPRKGQEFMLNTNIFNSIIFPTPNKLTKGTLIIPTADGNTMIGPTAEDPTFDFTEVLSEKDPHRLPELIGNCVRGPKFNTGTTSGGFNAVFDSVLKLGREDLMKKAKASYFGTFAGNRSVIQSWKTTLDKADADGQSSLAKELSKYNYLGGEGNVKTAAAFRKALFEGDGTNMRPNDNDFLIRSLFFEDYIEFAGIQSPGLTSGPSLGEYGTKLVLDILNKKNKANGVAEVDYSPKTYLPIEVDIETMGKDKALDMYSPEFDIAKYFDQEYNKCQTMFHPYVSPIKIPQEFGDAHLHVLEEHKQLNKLLTESNMEELKDIEDNPIICKCESISLKSILSAIRHGARSLDGIKHRTRQGMGVCQGGFCIPRIVGILAEELKKMYCGCSSSNSSSHEYMCDANHEADIDSASFIPAVTKCGKGSFLIGGGFKANRKPVLNKFPNFNLILKGQKDETAGKIDKDDISGTCLEKGLCNDVSISIIGGGPAGIGALLGILESVLQQNKNKTDDKMSDLNLYIHIFDRNPSPGGILIQCIHSGFGLKKFQKELTGPEYGENLWNLVNKKMADIREQNSIGHGCANVTVVPHFGSFVENCYYNKGYTEPNNRYTLEFKDIKGNEESLNTQYLMLCSGSRERPPSAIFLWNTTRSIGGVYTAGQLQRMLNNEGYAIYGTETGTRYDSVMGKGNEMLDIYGFQHLKELAYTPSHPFKCVVLGSGDIGLIMVRRLKYNFAEVYKRVQEGEKIEGNHNSPFASIHINVYEIKPTISGLRRNVLTCCTDNDVSIRCNTTVIGVKCLDSGNEVKGIDMDSLDEDARKQIRRISAVTLKDFSTGEVWDEECDLLVLSVGLQQDIEVNTRASINKYFGNSVETKLKATKIPVRSIINYVPPVAPIVSPSLSVSITDFFNSLSLTGTPYVPSKQDDNSLFICGNSLHIHDLADSANAEGERVGKTVGSIIFNNHEALKAGKEEEREKEETCGSNLKPVSLQGILYLIPRMLPLDMGQDEHKHSGSSLGTVTLSFRVLNPMAFCDVVLSLLVKVTSKNGGVKSSTLEVMRMKRMNVEPAEMEVIPVAASVFDKARKLLNNYLDSLDESNTESVEASYKLEVVETGKRVVPEGAQVLTCITCPNGCTLVVEETHSKELKDMEEILSHGTPILDKRYVVSGNRCPRGVAYASTELSAPVRQFSLSVNVPSIGMVPVKPKLPVPKTIIEKVISYITRSEVEGEFNGIPSGAHKVTMGDVLMTVPSIEGHEPIEIVVCKSVGN